MLPVSRHLTVPARAPRRCIDGAALAPASSLHSTPSSTAGLLLSSAAASTLTASPPAIGTRRTSIRRASPTRGGNIESCSGHTHSDPSAKRKTDPVNASLDCFPDFARRHEDGNTEPNWQEAKGSKRLWRISKRKSSYIALSVVMRQQL